MLRDLGVAHREAQAVESRARLAGVAFQAELVASGMVGETVLYQALARYLGLGFASEVDPARLIIREDQCLKALRRVGGPHAVVFGGCGGKLLLLAPGRLNIPAMADYLQRFPRMVRQIRIVPPTVLREAVKKRARQSLARNAVNGLFDEQPWFSARTVVTARQGAAFGAFAVAMPVSLWLWPSHTLLALHLFLSLAFLSCVLLRLAAGSDLRDRPPAQLIKAVHTQEMPVYTVLVALYKEAEIVPDLLVALGRLVWPRGKLEIKLVCESDDRETLEAIRAHALRSSIEVIEVPPEGPRTKPKALAYALPTTSGPYIALYDAEDKPHPFQLVEAWQRFRASDEELACLQAPLVVSNRRESWISSMFAFEYSALFHGILPWLARRGLILPLGGTSNHFRREALEHVGGWDPCNVTEDADLGVRLRRYGYRAGTLTFPTYEDAPTRIREWLPQRTRWFKGWMQTWLVHMRDVPALMQDLGPRSFLVMQVLFAGMLLSALANLAFLLTIVAFAGYYALSGTLPVWHGALLAVDLFNIVFGYGAFLALGWWTRPRTEQRGLWRYVLLTPVYWVLLSLAAWRALWHLYRRPHHWEKTPHRPPRLRAARRRA